MTSLLWMLKYTHLMQDTLLVFMNFFSSLSNCVRAEGWKCFGVHSSAEIPYQLTENLECFQPLIFL